MAGNKRQIRGTLVLLVLLAITSFAYVFFTQFLQEQDKAWADQMPVNRLDSLVAEIEARQYADSLRVAEERKRRQLPFEKNTFRVDKPLILQPFDPNTVDKATWLAMNLPERVFTGLEKYRQKGGKFRKPGQLLKLYALDSLLGQKLLPFVKIDSSQWQRKPPAWAQKPFPERPKYQPFNINEADTTQLMKVYGIGRGIANRIVRHRTGLGGFYSKDHLYDVFGLDSSVVEELMLKGYLPENPEVQKLNINAATEEELARNPYIRKGLARVVVRFRANHGPFSKPEDLLKIKILDARIVEKLRPYLEF